MIRKWKIEIRNWLRRWWIRQLIKFADRAEERLHDWQVNLRGDLGQLGRLSDRSSAQALAQQEARRSGVAVVSKKSLRQAAQKNYGRRRGMTASAFDLRFAR